MAKPKWKFLRSYRGVDVYYAANKGALRELGGADAVYEGGEIFVRDSNPSRETLRHEHRHAQQHASMGFLFTPAYFVCDLFFGYDGNPFEEDARAYARRGRA